MKLILLFVFITGTLIAGGANKEPTIRQPADQTDIFAIPLDEDEESQDEELKELEKPRK